MSARSAKQGCGAIPDALYGIIGHPLGHTLSPTLHNWGFAAQDLGSVYMAWPLEPKNVPAFVTAVRTLPISGCSVTIPHKEAVMDYLDGVTDLASRIGAVNTLLWRDGRLVGENTDIAGFMAPLSDMDVKTGLVLGGGGAARSAVAGLLQRGCGRVCISNRTREKAERIAAEMGAQWPCSVDVAPWEERRDYGADLVVNTTPMGMLGDLQELTPWDASWFRSGQIAYDIVYNPLETRFLREAAAAGCVCIDGLSMFIGQGVEQFWLWTGMELDAKAARVVLKKALQT